MAYARTDAGLPGEKSSNFATLIRHADVYGLSRQQAHEVVDRIVSTISDHFDDVADASRMSSVDRRSMWGRQFLNPGALHGL